MLVDRATTSLTFIFQNTEHADSLKEKLDRELGIFCVEYYLMKFPCDVLNPSIFLTSQEVKIRFCDIGLLKLTVNSLASLAHLKA